MIPGKKNRKISDPFRSLNEYTLIYWSEVTDLVLFNRELLLLRIKIAGL